MCMSKLWQQNNVAKRLEVYGKYNITYMYMYSIGDVSIASLLSWSILLLIF